MTIAQGESWTKLFQGFKTQWSLRERLEKAGDLDAAQKVDQQMRGVAVGVIAASCVGDSALAATVTTSLEMLRQGLGQALAKGDRSKVIEVDTWLIETALNSRECLAALAKLDARNQAVAASTKPEAGTSGQGGSIDSQSAAIIKAMTEAIKAMPAPVVNVHPGDTFVEVGDTNVHAHMPGRAAQRIVGQRMPDGSMLATVVDACRASAPDAPTPT